MTTRGGHSHPRQNDGLRVPVAAVECRRESSAWRSSLRTRPCEPPRAVQASAGAIGVVMARRSVLSVAATTSSRVRAVGRASPPSRCARGGNQSRARSASMRIRVSVGGSAGVSVGAGVVGWRRSAVQSQRCVGWSAVRQWRFVSTVAASSAVLTSKGEFGESAEGLCPDRGWFIIIIKTAPGSASPTAPGDPVTSRRQGKNDTPCGSASGAKPVSFCRRARDRLVRCTSAGQSVRLCCAA